MLTVDHYEIIRRLYRDENLSQRQLAKKLGHSRTTIAKVLKCRIPPGYCQSKPRIKRVLAPFEHIIDQWLEDNKKARRKQKQNATKIHQRLVNEYNFTGHYTTVQRYIQQASNRKEEVFMPLQFDPGQEAQVDWHEGYIVQNGLERKVNFFCMKLCYSKAPFVYPYEKANLESFLDGHVRAFQYFGGVPRRIAYDNLKTAVIKVLKGKKRKLTKRFEELKCWYLFDIRFCNIAKGNEKGDVENLAKRSQNWFLSPMPVVNNLKQLADKLLEECEKELDTYAPAPHKTKTKRELFEQEKEHLFELPPQLFEACVYRSTFVDKHLLVRYDTNRYSVPLEYAYQSCRIKAFVDRIEIYHKAELIATHERCYDKDQFILEPLHYIKLLKTKPGTVDNARAFKGQPWGEDFEFMRRELEYRYGSEGTKRYISILLLFTKYKPEEVKESVSICVKCRAFSDEAVESFIRNNGLFEPALKNKGNGIRDLNIYNKLCQEVLV